MAEPHSFLSIDTALDSNGTTVANGPSLTDGISISPALSTTQSTGTVKAAKDGHTTGSKTTRLKADDNPTEDDPMILQIYNKLNEMFGQGDEDIFQMEFPARLLEQGNYDYSGSNSPNAQQIKPPSVQEAEFRLANGTYALANLVGGPRGGSLSEAYRQLIFQLLPANESDSATNETKIAEDHEHICQWLIEEVPDFEPPTRDILSIIPDKLNLPQVPPVYNDKDNDNERLKALRDATLAPKIPRIDLYQKLLDLYESERLRWAQFKISARPRDDAPETQHIDYDRLLTSYAPAIDAKLEAIWAMLLIRGQYHRIRKYLGMVDIEFASEALQRAKENMRASVSRSIDDTEDIYPVVLTPANWAAYLSTAFKPEDLLESESTVRLQLLQAEKDRAALIRQKNNLLAGSQDIKALEQAQVNARKALSSAQTTLAAGYSERALSAIQIYFDTVAKAATKKAEAVLQLTNAKMSELNKTLENFNSPALTDEQWEKLVKIQAQCFEQQEAAQLAGEAYSRAQLAASLARGKDATLMIATLDDQIQSLELDIDFYKRSLGGSSNPTGTSITKLDENGKDAQETTKPPGVGDDGKPDARYNGFVDESLKIPEQTAGASVWQEIVLTSKNAKSKAASSLSASVSHSDWSVSLFFGSGSGSSDKSESHKYESHSSENTDIRIGMRIMKVNIDRPWMNTGLLDQTKEFYHTNGTRISHGAPSDVKTWLPPSKDPGRKELDNPCMLPSWTTGFVVVKDVHIIMQSEKEWSTDETNDMQSSSNSGGGFLCFSCSRSDSSSHHDNKSAFTSNKKTLSIKIPAPQVLGWITHLAPKDECKGDYKSLPQNELFLKDQTLQGTDMEGKSSSPNTSKTSVDGFAAHSGTRSAPQKQRTQVTSNQNHSTLGIEKGFVDGFAARGAKPTTPPQTPPIAS